MQAATKHRIAVSATFLIHGMVVGNWLSRIPAVRDRLGLSASALGISLLGAAVGALLAMPVAARLCDSWGSRLVTRATSIAFCASLCLPAFVKLKWLLFPALLVYGAAAGAMDVSMNTQGSDVEKLRGKPTMSSFHALFSIGGMFGAGIGALAARHEVAVRTHLAAVALVLIPAAALAGLWLVPGRDEPYEAPFRLRAMRGTLLGLSVISFCVLLGEGAMADWSAVYLRDVANAASATAALGYAVFSATMAAGRLCGDAITNRFGAVTVVRSGSLLAATGLFVALAVGNTTSAMIGFALVGAGFATIFPLMCSAAAVQRNVSPAAGIAAVSTTGYLGFLVGPPVIGVIADAATLRLALVVVIMLSFAAAMLAPAAQQSVGTKRQDIKDIVSPTADGR